jgi:hypothetical protein
MVTPIDPHPFLEHTEHAPVVLMTSAAGLKSPERSSVHQYTNQAAPPPSSPSSPTSSPTSSAALLIGLHAIITAILH